MQPLGPLLPFVLIGALCGMTGATTANCLDNLVSIDNGSNPDTFMCKLTTSEIQCMSACSVSHVIFALNTDRYSSGKQLNDLGVWSGCHGNSMGIVMPGVLTPRCVAFAGIPSAQYCLITPMIGACLPDICSEDDVKENMPLVSQEASSVFPIHVFILFAVRFIKRCTYLVR